MTRNISVWALNIGACVKASFSLAAGLFLGRFSQSPNDLQTDFIDYNASAAPHIGPFSETIINVLRTSFFSVHLLLNLICLVALPAPPRNALMASVI